MTMISLIAGIVVLGQPGPIPPLEHVESITDGLRAPGRVAVMADGTVLVTEGSSDAIARYAFDGQQHVLLGTWSIPDGPIGVTEHPDGRIVVSLREPAKVGLYTVDGNGVLVFQGYLGEGIVTFVRPTDVDVASDTGIIYVVDSGADRIYGFNADGTLALILGERGEFSSQFKYPSVVRVDEANDRLLVADQDNFRVQVFSRSGQFLDRFGARIRYRPGRDHEGWMPRPQGMEIDSTGHVFVSDAMMGTVRVFDPLGVDLGKVVMYGFNPGNVRTPFGMALNGDGSWLYVVSTGSSSVEVFKAPNLDGGGGGLPGKDPSDPTFAMTRRASRRDGRLRSRDASRGLMPALAGDVADPAWYVMEPDGGFEGPGTDPMEGGYDGPHMIEGSVICGRCHAIDNQPGGHVGMLEGQTVLCYSCHSSAGQALAMPVHEADVADPYGSNPGAPDGLGVSHAWGVSAVNAEADSVGPAPGGVMDRYLADGKIKCATCHDQHNGGMGGPYLRFPNDEDQMCKECHAPRNEGPGERGTHAVGFDYPGGQGEYPLDPDVAPLAIKNGKVECMTCHGVHDADSGGANGGTGDGMILRASNDEALCQSCHTEHAIHAPGGGWQPTCGDCHDIHDPHNENLSLVAGTIYNRTLGADKDVVFTARSGPGSFSDGIGPNDGVCQVCHTTTSYHRHDGSGAPHNEGATCTDCHPHSGGFMPVGGSCIACHSQPRGNRPKVVNADGTGGHHLSGGPLKDEDCVVCHEMTRHRAGTVRLWLDPNNPTTPLPLTGDPAELVPFCGACHNGQDPPAVHAIGGPWEPVCTECHEIHDPANTNLSLVNDVIHNKTLDLQKPVVFTARTGPGSFSDGVGPNDGVCQVCHVTTNYHRHDGSGAPHNEGADCAACHPHAAGFTPTGGSCLDCHNAPQGGRREVVSEFGLASHHLQGDLNEADCIVCHDMSRHQQGQVRLRNVDDPNNPDAVVVLTGDPFTDPVEAGKLEVVCLACHDDNGANGAPPFGNGIAPVSIDATLWGGASHHLGGQPGPMTCFGDGEVFGCHDTGHGSGKRKLLAPWDVSQPPAPGDPRREEEGMCYTCHDSDGPASTDIESAFGLATHHNVSAPDQGDGSRVECVNCHDPHAASATAKLADPDTGGVWGGTGADFCVVCHDGTPPPGVSFPGGGPGGTGYDKSAFAGTTHATQLGPDSCRHCHDEHGAPFRSLLRAEYVIADYNAYAPSDYAACWVCHDATETVQNENAFRRLHDKHVRGEDASCMICHDVHGGADPGEPGLVNFTFGVREGYDIQLTANGQPYTPSTAFWITSGPPESGNCALTCHGKEHKPKNYERRPNPVVDCSACHAP